MYQMCTFARLQNGTLPRLGVVLCDPVRIKSKLRQRTGLGTTDEGGGDGTRPDRGGRAPVLRRDADPVVPTYTVTFPPPTCRFLVGASSRTRQRSFSDRTRGSGGRGAQPCDHVPSIPRRLPRAPPLAGSARRIARDSSETGRLMTYCVYEQCMHLYVYE